MITIEKPADVRKAVASARREGKSIGFVPTMGALHEGHAALVGMARMEAGLVVVSIFVNPAQFGPAEDFLRYPRKTRDDALLLEREGCDLLFMPSAAAMYPRPGAVGLTVKGLADRLCGAFRPGHFDGVCLVVAKLFNMVQPDLAFFGQKDAQQAIILERMTADLDFPVRIRIGATVREPGGLAMSSRNAYLDRYQRERARGLYRSLRAAAEAASAGERRAEIIRKSIRAGMEDAGFDVEYAEVVDARTLLPVDIMEGVTLLAAAGRIGDTRLIDNIVLRVGPGGAEEILLTFPERSGSGE
ncbi:MAG: pantoate--beta-alanine ligase [Candidatus Krumholzibacteria bacterium]|nr:pantoate--beta-alanine ligase [Candidatus Krumholzibacteria bacterium]